MEFKVQEKDGKYYVMKKVTKFFFFTKWVNAHNKINNGILVFDNKRSAQCYINFQKNPRIKN